MQKKLPSVLQVSLLVFLTIFGAWLGAGSLNYTGFLLLMAIHISGGLVVSFLYLQKQSPPCPVSFPRKNMYRTVLAALAALEITVGMTDIGRWKISLLPSWLMVPGLLLAASAYFLWVLCIQAKSEADLSRPYPANPVGPYASLRYPLAAVWLLLGLSVPLIIGSGLAFVGFGVALVVVAIMVYDEEHWRYMQFDDYPRYQEKVPYKIMPFL